MEMDQQHQWKVLEFYSGIGGMRYSLMEARVNAKVVEAFDINDTANDVYQHNFGHRPYQGNIQTLTAADLDRYQAEAWILSPPCQPYTRQGHQKGSNDARAFSFLKIIELIRQLSHPPLMLFVENVVGFEKSDTHDKLLTILGENNFVTQEFILSPMQFGLPYSRPRYFCLAKRKPLSFVKSVYNNQILATPAPLVADDENAVSNQSEELKARYNEWPQECQPISKFLQFNHSGNGTSVDSSLDMFTVPSALIERWGSAMDIVFPDSKRCCCFTKSYYRYVKGTGSILATIQGKVEDKTSMDGLGLRYFTPREVANFHSFPESFQFPPHVSKRQCYALLGNSLSVSVVAPLLGYLFS
ncbi:hypothetical protein Leryth_020983 [Lithospermum erythrorhizon]|nr:hypothetical protein Leryth_020983 [Lithospermum erythrorhizon]